MLFPSDSLVVNKEVLRNLVLSLKLSSSTWMGTLLSTLELQRHCCVYSLRRNQEPGPDCTTVS